MKILGLGAVLALVGMEGCRLPSWKLGSSQNGTHSTRKTDGLDSASSLRNAERLGEVYRVVLMRDASNRQAFGSWVDSLNQGASFDGVYRAFTHSDLYRELEKGAVPAPTAAYGRFEKWFLDLRSERKSPDPLQLRMGEPLAGVVMPDGTTESDPGGVRVVEFGKKTEVLEELDARRVFGRSSGFTLKRVLGEEVLAVIDEKRSGSPGDLSDWYARFSVRTAAEGVDFGLPQRNLADELFHREWARHAEYDALVWECLNRVHRLLNAALQPTP